ncbi:Pantothenate transporter liz1 [Fusarium oxysporum f. sp. albedinis]|nr:Pantothenate transporter liz1 [Fusarium oxysporum f. sp. albedinis]
MFVLVAPITTLADKQPKLRNPLLRQGLPCMKTKISIDAHQSILNLLICWHRYIILMPDLNKSTHVARFEPVFS